MAIYDMLRNGSGFAWNDVLKSVSCEKVVFDALVLSHPSANGLLNKSFPHYDTLIEIYAKDRAIGSEAFGPEEAEEQINDAVNIIEQQAMDEDEPKSIDVSSTAGGSTRSYRRKRARASDNFVSGLTDMASSICKLVEGTNGYMEKLCVALNLDSDVSTKVVEELLKMEGLSLDQKLSAANIIIRSTSNSTMFMAALEEMHPSIVHAMLGLSPP